MKDSRKIKTLKIFQQSELNACVMYKGLAQFMQNSADRELLLQIAAEEGKHAGILKGITNETLSPTDRLKKMVISMYKAVGRKAVFKVLVVSEAAAAKAYRPFFAGFAETKAIASDEMKHSGLLKNRENAE